MTDEKTQDILDALTDLIEEERAALLSGQIDAISELLQRKENLIAALEESQPTNRGALEALQIRMARNQVLYDQALQGIRNVADRLSALRRLRKSLETYDQLGRKTEIAAPVANRLERRA